MGWTTPLNRDEATYLQLAITTLGGTVLVGGGWYFFTSVFYRATPVEHRERVDHFFAQLATPVDKQGTQGVQTVIYKLIGALCLVYGGFILALALIPNPPLGRACFLFCGGVMFGVGALLHWIGRKRDRAFAATTKGALAVAS
jgi:hypothetical protein